MDLSGDLRISEGTLLQKVIELVVWRDHKRMNDIVFRKMSIPLKMLWILDNIATPCAVFITIFYWSILYDPDDGAEYFNIYVHGLNSVMVLLDLVVSNKPYRWQHFYIPIIFGVW